MAITATIALNPSTVNAGGGGSGFNSVATVTINNTFGGGVNVPILGIRPVAYDQGTKQSTESVTLGACQLPASIPFGGSVTAQFNVVAFQPQVTDNSGSGNAVPATQLQYDITCEIVCGDGEVIIPTVATLTVNQPPRTLGG